MFLHIAARKWITKAAKMPSKVPNTADSTLWVVYTSLTPAMFVARREPRANASLVANSDRKRLGSTIPAKNKVNASSMISRASEKTFCLFIVFAFSFGTAFSKNPLGDCVNSAEQQQAYGQSRFPQECLPVPLP